MRVVAGTLSSVKGVGTGLDLDKVVTPIWGWVIEVPVVACHDGLVHRTDGLLGVFLPSLPYVIFMTVVVGWILAVLQSIIAAPLWAVMHRDT